MVPARGYLIDHHCIFHEVDEAMRVHVGVHCRNQLCIHTVGSRSLEEALAPLLKVEVLQIVNHRQVVDPFTTLRDELVSDATVAV